MIKAVNGTNATPIWDKTIPPMSEAMAIPILKLASLMLMELSMVFGVKATAYSIANFFSGATQENAQKPTQQKLKIATKESAMLQVIKSNERLRKPRVRIKDL